MHRQATSQQQLIPTYLVKNVSEGKKNCYHHNVIMHNIYRELKQAQIFLQIINNLVFMRQSIASKGIYTNMVSTVSI